MLVKVNFFSTRIVINGKTVSRVNFTSPLNDDAEMMVSSWLAGNSHRTYIGQWDHVLTLCRAKISFLLLFTFLHAARIAVKNKNRKLVVECAGVNFMTCWLNNNNISFLITSSELLIRQVHSSFAVVTRKIRVLCTALEWIHQLIIIFYLRWDVSHIPHYPSPTSHSFTVLTRNLSMLSHTESSADDSKLCNRKWSVGRNHT